MKPIKFNEQNVIFTGPKGSGIQPLAAFQDEDCIISCFKMSFKERIAAIVFGRVWLYVTGKKIPPVKLLSASTAFNQLAWWKRCIFCGGTGYVPGSRQYKDKGINIKRDCPHCEGSGLNRLSRFFRMGSGKRHDSERIETALGIFIIWLLWDDIKWMVFGMGAGLAAFFAAVIW